MTVVPLPALTETHQRFILNASHRLLSVKKKEEKKENLQKSLVTKERQTKKTPTGLLSNKMTMSEKKETCSK